MNRSQNVCLTDQFTMSSEVYGYILPAQVRVNASKRIRRHLKIIIPNIHRSFFKAKKCKFLKRQSQSPNLNPKHAFCMLKSKLKTDNKTLKQTSLVEHDQRLQAD